MDGDERAVLVEELAELFHVDPVFIMLFDDHLIVLRKLVYVIFQYEYAGDADDAGCQYYDKNPKGNTFHQGKDFILHHIALPHFSVADVIPSVITSNSFCISALSRLPPAMVVPNLNVGVQKVSATF